jgi:hypothetical protein
MSKQESVLEIVQVTIFVIMRSFNSSPLKNYKFVNMAIY